MNNCSEMCLLDGQAVFMMLGYLHSQSFQRATNKEILNGDRVTVSGVEILPGILRTH